jgi:hypothetical protein
MRVACERGAVTIVTGLDAVPVLTTPSRMACARVKSLAGKIG